MKYTTLLFFFFILIFSKTGIGQPLNGTYTIGGNSPDFSNLSAAVNSMSSNGISGNIIFNIRPGIYPESVSIQNISYDTSLSITFQSESGDSSDVLLEDSLIFNLYNSNVIFNRLSFKGLVRDNCNCSQVLCIRCIESRVIIKHCYFTADSINYIPYSSYTIYDSGGREMTIDSSSIYSPCYGVGGDFNIEITNDYFLTNFASIYNSSGNSILTNSFFDSENGMAGGVDIEGSSTLVMENNSVYSASFLETDSAKLLNNQFIGDVQGLGSSNHFISIGNTFTTMDMEGVYLFQNNTLGEGTILGTTPFTKIVDNEIQNLTIQDSKYDTIINNEVTGSLDLLNIDSSLVEKNTINNLEFDWGNDPKILSNQLKRIGFVFTTGTIKVYNNYISEGLYAASTPDTVFLYQNNIILDSINSFSEVGNVYVINNNFNNDLSIDTENLVSDYNNYYPRGGLKEKHSTFFDPAYINNSVMKSQNILLAGKGENLFKEVPEDINNLPRSIHPTIGANEIYALNNQNHFQEINIVCGDTLDINIFNNSAYTYSWLPITNLSNPYIANPNFSHNKSETYVCTVKMNTTIIETDTILISVSDFQLEPIDSYYIRNCGQYGIELSNTKFNPYASYHWSPSTGIDSIDIRTPTAFPLQTTTYIVEAEIPSCSSSYDTVIVQVNPLPFAYWYQQYPNTNNVSLINISTCAGYYKWNYCDGGSDTAKNPTHIFADTGFCLVTLYACNSYGCDSFSGYIYIPSPSGVAEIPKHEDIKLKISPVPSSGIFIVSLDDAENAPAAISISDCSGRNCLNKILLPVNGILKENIDLSGYSKGIYIIKIIADKKSYCGKIVIE